MQTTIDFLDLNPQEAIAYRNRGDAYYRLRKSHKAIADYNKAIALNPQDAVAYWSRGNAYYRLGKNSQAIADYNKAIALDPQNADAYYNSGLVYIILGEKEKAKESWLIAAELYHKQDRAEKYQNTIKLIEQL